MPKRKNKNKFPISRKSRDLQETAVASKGKTVVSGTEDNPVIKGNLDDILHAIDIEESPIVQVDFIGIYEHKHKKVQSTKKLQFEGENVAFIFQARKP